MGNNETTVECHGFDSEVVFIVRSRTTEAKLYEVRLQTDTKAFLMLEVAPGIQRGIRVDNNPELLGCLPDWLFDEVMLNLVYGPVLN